MKTFTPQDWCYATSTHTFKINAPYGTPLPPSYSADFFRNDVTPKRETLSFTACNWWNQEKLVESTPKKMNWKWGSVNPGPTGFKCEEASEKEDNECKWKHFDHKVKSGKSKKVLTVKKSQPIEHLHSDRAAYGYGFIKVGGEKRRVYNSYEQDVIRLIVKLRSGITKYDLRIALEGLNANIQSYVYTRASKKGIIQRQIAELLNDVGIYKRGTLWTQQKISEHCVKNNV